MNKALRRLGIDIVMTMLFLVLGLAVSYAAGAPVISMMKSQWNMLVEKGAPGYTKEYIPQPLELEQEGTSNLSEVKVPALGESYGDISCERITLAASIFYGDTDDSFEKGVGQYVGSGLPGQGKPILIGGHDGTYFAPLEHILVGDIVTITTDYGKYDYQVTELKDVKRVDSTVYDLTLLKEQLILYTCYPFGQLVGNREGRYFVFCDRISDTVD